MSTFDSIAKTTITPQAVANAPVSTPIKEKKETNAMAETKEIIPAVSLESKPDIIDLISKKAIDPKDVNDTVTMPRAIFKGYLCFTAGTAINAISGLIKNKPLKTGLGIAGSLISILGTFNFVKPFLHKEPTEKQ